MSIHRINRSVCKFLWRLFFFFFNFFELLNKYLPFCKQILIKKCRKIISLIRLDCLNSFPASFSVCEKAFIANMCISETVNQTAYPKMLAGVFDQFEKGRNCAKKWVWTFRCIVSSFLSHHRRPNGAVVREAVCCTRGSGFESRVRHKCRAVHPWLHQ